MKVNDPNLSGVPASGVGRTQQTDSAANSGGKTGKSGAVSSGDDHVQLSSLSSQLRALDSESPERAAYLERLSEEMQAGKYRPDFDAVSRAIVQDALDDKGE